WCCERSVAVPKQDSNWSDRVVYVPRCRDIDLAVAVEVAGHNLDDRCAAREYCVGRYRTKGSVTRSQAHIDLVRRMGDGNKDEIELSVPVYIRQANISNTD